MFQLPKLMELVGLGYTGWFVYRYLLFKVGNLESNRVYVHLSGDGDTVNMNESLLRMT